MDDFVCMLKIYQETASRQGVSAMPTFQFFKSQTKVDEMTGADPKKLEEKIKKWIGDEEDGDGGCGVKGHVRDEIKFVITLNKSMAT